MASFTPSPITLNLLLLCFLLLSVLLLYLVVAVLSTFPQLPRFSSGHKPPSYPVIGCLISYCQNRTRLLDWYTQMLKESATNTIVVHRLGARRTIVTANPENVEYILKTNFNNFPKGKPFTEVLGDLLGCGIFNVDGELWRAQRKLASHEFTAKSIREYFMLTLKEEVGKQLLPVLERLAETGDVVDLQELLRRLAFKMICKVSLGTDPCSWDPSLPVADLAKAFDMASEICAKRGAASVFIAWKIKRWLGIGSERKLKDAFEQIHSYVSEIVASKRKIIEGGHNHNSEDFLSRLMLAGHKEVIIRDLVINFIMAGKDTTSAAMTWLFWLLSCHPNAQREVVQEAKQVIERMVDYESLADLVFLEACLRESMRLYPPVVWDSKHAMTDDTLPDKTAVRSGDRVTYFPYGMGRMEALWGKDWSEFKPERWLLQHDKRRVIRKVCPYKFPIFQAGPRVCLGKKMAFIQMKYVVASILEKFELQPVSSSKPVFVPLLTAHMAGGLRVLVRKRNS